MQACEVSSSAVPLPERAESDREARGTEYPAAFGTGTSAAAALNRDVPPPPLPAGLTSALYTVNDAAVRCETEAEYATYGADRLAWGAQMADRDRLWSLFDRAIRRAALVGRAQLVSAGRFTLRTDYRARVLAFVEIDGSRFACPAEVAERGFRTDPLVGTVNVPGAVPLISEEEATAILTTFAADEPNEDLRLGAVLLKKSEAWAPIGYRRPDVAARFERTLNFSAYDSTEAEVRDLEKELNWVVALAEKTARTTGIPESSWPHG